MLALLQRVAEVGPPRNAEISHQIQGAIWQFRSGRVRVLWFYGQGREVLLSNAFEKDSRKTPRAELQRALETSREFHAAVESVSLERVEEVEE